jgi:hypothetical protein
MIALTQIAKNWASCSSKEALRFVRKQNDYFQQLFQQRQQNGRE